MIHNETIVNLNPSFELSYILGVYYGDGTLDHSKNVIQLVAEDKDFVDEFLRCFSKISNKSYESHNYGKYYRAHPASKQFYSFILNKDAQEFSEIIELFPTGFIKGFYDSDGGIDIITQFTRRIKMSNTDLKLLEYIQYLLNNLNIPSKIHAMNKIGTVVYEITGQSGKTDLLQAELYPKTGIP